MDSNPAPNMLPTDPGVNFHALADYAFLGMVCLRPSGEILYANLAAARLLELPGPHDLVGRSVQQIAGKPGQWDVFLAALAEPGAVRELELELQTARGRTRVCLCSAHHLNGTISATLLDITDRLRMGKELRKLSRVVSQMADMVVITDQQGIIEYVNRSFELITGYTQDEALGSSISLLESGRHTPQFYRQMWDTILGGKVFQADVINRRKNGELFYQNQTMTPIRDGVRGITNFVITGKDITERKRASELLEKSQASLENAQSIAHLGNWELDFTAGPGDWSQEMYHLFGCDPAAGPPTYAAFLALIHPDDLPAMLAAERAAQEQDAWVTVEFRTAPERGEPRYFQGTLHAVRDAAGGVVGMTGTTLEITALKLAQLELETLNRELEQRVDERTAEVRRQEATYRALFENSHDGIFLFSPDGRLLQANPQALALVGYSLDEYRALIAEHPQAAAPSERLRQAQASFQAALQGEIVPLFETTLTRKDGQKVDIEINLSMVRGADGQAALVQSVVRDITLRKVSEAALKESRDNLRAANATLQHAARLKDEFLASMSHELRTPLTGILGLAESLQFQTYGELNERQIKCLSIMESSGRHLLDLINDILDLSKIEAGKMSVDLEACRVSDICRSSLQLIKGMATKKRQLVTYAIQRESIVLLADARRLKQMLVNLLSNAVKFTQDAGSLGLEVCLNEADQVVEFAVWDKGIGIAPENLDRLFTPFTQIDSQISRQFSGTGLGLSLVKRMAELHGGSLKVESTAGEGSRFTLVMPWSADIVLPAVEPAPQEARASGPQRLQDANGAPAYKPLILVCDDNQEILDLVADYLLINGFRIVSVQNGAELLQRTVELQPDLLVTDIQLPGVEGLDILRQLRAHPQPAVAGLPVLALTALAMAGDRERVLKAGADDYLSKPLVLKQLVDRIGALLKARSGA